jgi:hypothetical protein
MADESVMEQITPTNVESNAPQELKTKPEDSGNIFGMDFIPLRDGDSTEDSDNPSGSASGELQNQSIQTGIQSKSDESNVKDGGSNTESDNINAVVNEDVAMQAEETNIQPEVQEKVEENVAEAVMEIPGPSRAPDHDDDDHSGGDDDGNDDDFLRLLEDDDDDDNDDRGDNDDEGGESELKDEEMIDPYSYTKRENEFTSEIFKIEVANLPRKYGFKVSFFISGYLYGTV